jgi:hypothetical protein
MIRGSRKGGPRGDSFNAPEVEVFVRKIRGLIKICRLVGMEDCRLTEIRGDLVPLLRSFQIELEQATLRRSVSVYRHSLAVPVDTYLSET